MSEPIELPHIDRIDYVGGSYPMAIKPDGEYVDYDDHVAIVRQLTEQRAELLAMLQRLEKAGENMRNTVVESRGLRYMDAHDFALRDSRELIERIANATQQRKEPGA